MENTGNFQPGWREGQDPLLLFPDLKNIKYEMSTSYVFTNNFSYRNVLYQTEWQCKSAGSFVPGLFYNYTRFSLSGGELRTKEHQINLRVVPAYYYTLVWNEHWFITANTGASLGYSITETRTNEDGVFTREQENYLTRFLEGGLQLGYSSERVIFGVNVFFSAKWYEEKE